MSVWLILGAVLVGAVVGSFLGMLIHRLPAIVLAEEMPGSPFFKLVRGLSVPRSHCPKCKRTLSARMLVPVFSFLRQRGYCAYCGAAIGKHVLLVELLTISAAVILLWQSPSLWQAVMAFVFFCVGIALAVIDWQQGILPDVLTLPLLWLGLVLNVSAQFVPLADAVLGAVLGYLSLWLVYQIHFALTKKEGLGYGDFKLFAAIGAWFGWQALPVVLFGASLLALAFALVQSLRGVSMQGVAIAFGPFLVLATGLVYVFDLSRWWWQLW